MPAVTLATFQVSRRTFLAGVAAACHAFSRSAWGAESGGIAELLERFRVPGLCVARIRDGDIESVDAFGCRALDPNAAMEPDTIFEVASLSKPAFACAVLRLRERGLINLDAPLAQYLGAPLPIEDERAQAITARMVLSHSSGLPPGREEGKPIELQFDPGSRFRYSPLGFDFLQSAVERITGMGLANLMEAEVLGPLQLTKSSFTWRDEYGDARASGYDAQGQPGITFNERFRVSTEEWRTHVTKLYPELHYPNAAAGMYSTAGECARLVCAMLPRRHAEPLLREETIRDMIESHVEVRSGVSWGLGWGLIETRKGTALWHWGNWSGLFQHFAAVYVQSGDGLVVLTNSGNGLRLCTELVPETMGLNLAPVRSLIL